jgi:membrane protein required for beta-lactamase induction
MKLSFSQNVTLSEKVEILANSLVLKHLLRGENHCFLFVFFALLFFVLILISCIGESPLEANYETDLLATNLLEDAGKRYSCGESALVSHYI